MALKKRTRFFYLMLQGKSIIPPATQAIKMWRKTFSIWHKLRTFSSRTSRAYFSLPLFLSYCHWFSEFEKKMDDGIVHTLMGALQVLESRLVGLSQISQKRNKKLLTAVYLTNRPQFFMVYTLIDHGNDVIKCSKLKWNHEPQASGFTAKFWTFCGVICMVYTCKSVHHGKLWPDLFFTVTLILLWKTKDKTTSAAWHVTSFPWSLLS